MRKARKASSSGDPVSMEVTRLVSPKPTIRPAPTSDISEPARVVLVVAA